MPNNRCMDCNATIREDELNCWSCGAATRSREVAPGLGSRFAMFINFFFIISLVITVASMFTDVMPPFLRCAAVSAVLFLVKSSATQMAEKGKRKG